MSTYLTQSTSDPSVAKYGEATITPTGNLTVFFTHRAVDVSDPEDSSILPDYMQKYVEYGVIARAYKANTDGRIQSLSEYWTLRRNAGLVAMKRYMSKRSVDRDYRLETGRMNSAAKSRRPQLPDEYPEVYP